MSRLIPSTMTQSPYDLAQALEKLQEAGFTEVEWCSAGSLAPHLDVAGITLKGVGEAVKTVERSGMHVYGLNIGGDYSLAQMEMVFMIAQRVGAHIVTYSCGSPRPDVSDEEMLRRRTAFNTELADLAGPYGVTVSIEAPHKGSLAATTETVMRYWALQDPRVRQTFDTAHLTYAGEDMIALAQKCVSRIAHVHLRDAVKGDSLKRYGQGTVDFGRFLQVLRDGGYRGRFSMEYPSVSEEDAAEKMQEAKAFLSRFDFS